MAWEDTVMEFLEDLSYLIGHIGGPGVGPGSQLSYQTSQARMGVLELPAHPGRMYDRLGPNPTYHLLYSHHLGFVSLWDVGGLFEKYLGSGEELDLRTLLYMVKRVEWSIVEGLGEEWDWWGFPHQPPVPLSHVLVFPDEFPEGWVPEGASLGNVFPTPVSGLLPVAERVVQVSLEHPWFFRIPFSTRSELMDLAVSTLVGWRVAGRSAKKGLKTLTSVF